MGLIRNYAQLARLNATRRRMRDIIRESQARYEERTNTEVLGVVKGRGTLLKTPGSHPWREPERYYLATPRGWRKLNTITGEYYKGMIEADVSAHLRHKLNVRLRWVVGGAFVCLVFAYAVVLLT